METRKPGSLTAWQLGKDGNPMNAEWRTGGSDAQMLGGFVIPKTQNSFPCSFELGTLSSVFTIPQSLFPYPCLLSLFFALSKTQNSFFLFFRTWNLELGTAFILLLALHKQLSPMVFL